SSRSRRGSTGGTPRGGTPGASSRSPRSLPFPPETEDVTSGSAGERPDVVDLLARVEAIPGRVEGRGVDVLGEVRRRVEGVVVPGGGEDRVPDDVVGPLGRVGALPAVLLVAEPPLV